MNVLLVSQCNKRALTQTRRILDQFAERRGERTWQTPITAAGLATLRTMLRKSARKNTAVACHWIRGRDHSELLWIVGDARRFNTDGAVPTNSTSRNILRASDENDWHSTQIIRLLAQLSALLHDLGKASIAFQERLRGERNEKNLYRHEWVSLRMFLAFVGDDDDAGWLARMAGEDGGSDADWTAPSRYLRDGVDSDIERFPFPKLTARAPLAAAIGWLIVTHHRLPIVPPEDGDGRKLWFGMRVRRFEQSWLNAPLATVTHGWNEVDACASFDQAKPYWELAGELPAIAPTWCAQARRVANALLDLKPSPPVDWLGDPYVMHLARLCLMLADHHYSSLGVDAEGGPVSARQRFVQSRQKIFANTTSPGVMKQSLLEHLLGVGHGAGQIAHALPGFERHLPRLANHRGLRKRSADKKFAWQDKAFDAACSLREVVREHGAFIVNMASTGCGKTLANARILYALSDPQLGMRASYALGLRTLTQQTGRSYRHDLGLAEDELAVLVGGSASRALFKHYAAQASATGSASTQALMEEDSHVLYEGNVADHPLLSRALANRDIAKLLSAPMLVCTVDHLAPATESLRAGRQIAPMLRLMSSDLVLDELDDYDLEDLPALTRLMHWAGMLGSRVVLSSATLPPALVQGMFLAYRAGRRHYRNNRGQLRVSPDAPVEVPCLWVDEFGARPSACADSDGFAGVHAEFVRRRVGKLLAAEPLRIAELRPLTIDSRLPKDRIRSAFANEVRAACLRLHEEHAQTDPVSGKRASFGLVRMANINPILDVARALCQNPMPEHTRLHLCVYHARFPLALRSAIENMLDSTFNRRDSDAVWRLPEIRHRLDSGPEQDHLFVVLASPVCEVGRDWDADWAVVEPSSMRSLIQLAGRVQRHRRQPPRTPNLLVFDTNLKGIEQGGGREPVFIHPGFEKKNDEQFQLHAHRLQQLLDEAEYHHLTAIPRIQPRPDTELRPHDRWVDLEHARIRASMLPAQRPTAPESSRRRSTSVPGLDRDFAAAAWLHPQAALSGVLPQQQPFRDDPLPGTTLVWLPKEDEEELVAHRVESQLTRHGQSPYVSAHVEPIELQAAERVCRWGEFDLFGLIEAHAETMGLELDAAARKFTTVEVLRSDQGWKWNEWLGLSTR